MERISALMDGEFDRNEAARIVHQLKDNAGLREAWDTYHLIGEAMRGECCPDTRVAQAVSAQLAAEPTILAPKRNLGESLRRLALPSVAAAAAVAAVTWMSLQTLQGPRSGAPMAEVVVPLTPIGEPSPLGSLIQPASVSASPPPIQIPSRRIDAYIQAHQEFSPSRTIHGLTSYARTVSASGSTESGR